MIKQIIILFFVLSNTLSTYAQHNNSNSFASLQDSLKILSEHMNQKPIEQERYNANYAFIKTLVEALKLPNSFNYSFDSLRTISMVRSSDAKFRLFTWHVRNNDGTYRYFGTIQMNTPDGKLKLFPLVDYTTAIKNPSDSSTTNDSWYGARYYQIIPTTKDSSCYTLLGWKGNTTNSTKKVIEVLSFKNGKANFGMNIFDGAINYKNKKRIIFEYNSRISMMLRYIESEKLIVFDHLSPANVEDINKPELYGPDMSYDGFELQKNRWQFKSDLPLKNKSSETDKQYIPPKK